jgi:glycosyltransferase involved in cell wall biosynthesis
MERVLFDLVSRSDRDRFEMHVMCLEYLGRFAEGLDGSAKLHVAAPMGRLSLIRPTSLASEIARIAPSIVHTHSGVWYKGSLAARLSRVPSIVHTEHGRQHPDPLSSRLIDGLAARRTDAIVAVSERLACDLPTLLRAAPNRVVFIPNGIDTEAHRPCADNGLLRRELGLASDTLIIGSIGRLESIKAYEVMVEAFARFVGTDVGRNSVLVIGGEGRSRPAIEQRVERHGLHGHVHLLGWRNDISDLHAAFSLFTLSSKSEGTSISLLEAMSAGVPPVVTNVGGNAAVLGPSLADRLVPSGDPEALSAAWAGVLATASSRARVSMLARERVLDAFGLDRMTRAYEDLYLRAASTGRAR